jgi:hypothetical protein
MHTNTNQTTQDDDSKFIGWRGESYQPGGSGAGGHSGGGPDGTWCAAAACCSATLLRNVCCPLCALGRMLQCWFAARVSRARSL